MRSAAPPEAPAPRPEPDLPAGSVLVCAYLLYVGIDHVEEEAWLARAGGVDELWVRNRYDTRKAASAPAEDEPAEAARRLLRRSIRDAWAFQSPTHFVRAGLLSESDLEELLASIRADLERNDAEDRARESRIVGVARELGLDPEPTGSGPDHWQARCPGANHPLLIQSATGSFGCGWCRRKGGEAELRAFVAERKAGRRTGGGPALQGPDERRTRRRT